MKPRGGRNGKAQSDVDEVLTTTRTVRKRLDLTKKVPRALIEECLEVAFQAPNGSNQNTWRWIVVDDPALIKKVAQEYITFVEAASDKMRAETPASRAKTR